MKTPDAPTVKSVEQLAEMVFAGLHETIISHEEGALSGNVESIHDMRVAIRRLRVALSNFASCLPKNARKRLQVELRNLANALGSVRDLDVMIAAMKASLLARSDEERPAISDLIQRLRARRRRRLRALRTYLQSKEYATFKREFPPKLISAGISERRDLPVKAQPEVIEQEHGQAA